MNKFYTAVLLGLLMAGSTALSKEVNVQGTMLPTAVNHAYFMCEAKGVLDELSDEFKAVHQSLQEGNYTFTDDTLNTAIQNWRIMVFMSN